jgi:hypothetical protein
MIASGDSDAGAVDGCNSSALSPIGVERNFEYNTLFLPLFFALLPVEEHR